MSKASIGFNNAAIEYIDTAIGLCKEAIDEIKINNTTDDAFDIMDSITKEIGQLNSLKGRISAINANINTALLAKEKEEKEKQKQANDSDN